MQISNNVKDIKAVKHAIYLLNYDIDVKDWQLSEKKSFQQLQSSWQSTRQLKFSNSNDWSVADYFYANKIK